MCLEPGTKEENTNATIKAMDHELVKIIGHPDDGRYELDYEEVVKKAKEKNILLEVNNSSINPNSFRPMHVKIIKNYLLYARSIM